MRLVNICMNPPWAEVLDGVFTMSAWEAKERMNEQMNAFIMIKLEAGSVPFLF